MTVDLELATLEQIVEELGARYSEFALFVASGQGPDRYAWHGDSYSVLGRMDMMKHTIRKHVTKS